MKKNTHAFTISELLVVIGIVGIIAQMTIPTLVQNTQEKEFKVAWKKAYAEIYQATEEMIMDNGGTLTGLCESGNLFANSDCISKEYMKYLRDVKSYNYLDNIANYPAYKQLNGQSPPSSGHTSVIFMNNGFMFSIYRFTATNGGIAVDVNGFKTPNTFGKDYFFAWIFPDKLKPAGYDGEHYWGGCESTSTGLGCSAKFLYDE